MITGMPRIAIAVENYSGVLTLFAEKLGMPVFDLSENSLKNLGAKVGLCAPKGGSNIEIMSPGDPESPLSQSVQGFLDRRGEGHFALMLEADEPDLEAETLLARGLNVMPRMAGAGGRDIHPNSTHGVLVRVYPTDSILQAIPKKHYQGVDASALTGIQRVLIAVHDLEQARMTYGTQFGMDLAESVLDSTRGVRSALCTPPSGGTIELVSVADAGQVFAGSIESFLALNGEGIYALVLNCGNHQKLELLLADAGITTTPVTGLKSVQELDTGIMSGARFWVE